MPSEENYFLDPEDGERMMDEGTKAELDGKLWTEIPGCRNE